MLGDDVELAGAEFAVEIRREQLSDVAAVAGQMGHVNNPLSCLRPRWMRLRTVPTGASIATAISS